MSPPSGTPIPIEFVFSAQADPVPRPAVGALAAAVLTHYHDSTRISPARPDEPPRRPAAQDAPTSPDGVQRH